MNNKDYKKKYEAALEKAEKLINFYSRPEYKEILFYAKSDLMDMFPEIELSEDEKMIDMAIRAVHAPEAQSCIRSWNVDPEDVIAWLEKQRHTKKIEWSEVDDENLKTVIQHVCEFQKIVNPANETGESDLTDWLKSIKNKFEDKETATSSKSMIVVTNKKTENYFYAKSVRINWGHYVGNLYVQPTVMITVNDIDDTIPVLGRKYLGNETGVITKTEAIGDNEKINIKYCAANGTIEYESMIYNAWIRDVDRNNGIIQLECDHVF